ncbi:MAG: A24 family peptidase [Desulfopila sp.]|jgi:leader peptidase (prepilin peptidase)/N-methyltransferase|nr:A24 family peptidase [Desulfopila sp.]
MDLELLLFLFSFLFGAVVGSFLNVVILRLPQEGGSIVFPASHCPSCQTPLVWYENIPLLSFLFLRGKCAHCKTNISLQYPVVELLMALLSASIFTTFGFTVAGMGYFIFAAALLCVIWIDIHHQIIPDVISLPGIVLGFLFSFFNPDITWQSSLIGILVGGGVLYAIAVLYLLLRKQEGMGGGDIKLLAMIGAFLGWQSLLFVIFFSSFSGALVGIGAMIKQGKGGASRIPFGPFLSIAALVFLFFQEQIFYFFKVYMEGGFAL